MKSFKFVLILWSMILILSRASGAYWPIYDLGEMSKDNYTHLSINNNCIIAGDFYYGGMYNYHACTYDPMSGEPILDLGTLPDGNSSQANCINDVGQIVGQSIGNDNQWHGCFFDASGNGENIDLGIGSASCINNAGLIVGAFSYSYQVLDINNPDFHLYLGGLSQSHPDSVVNCINDNGQIVGSGTTDAGQGHAVLFDASGGGENIDLGSLGFDMSRAVSINNAGLIIGEARISTGSMRACLFDPSGEGDNIDLGTLGGSASYARSINNQNQIIGYANSAGGFHACLFDISGNGQNIDLNDMIDPSYGWEWKSARKGDPDRECESASKMDPP